MGDLLAAAQQELAEAAGLLDLAEDGLDHLLAQAIAATASGPAQLVAHGGDQRAAALRRSASAARFAPEQNPASAETSFGLAPAVALTASTSGTTAAWSLGVLARR